MVLAAFIKTFLQAFYVKEHLYMLDFVKETSFIGSGGSKLLILR